MSEFTAHQSYPNLTLTTSFFKRFFPEWTSGGFGRLQCWTWSSINFDDKEHNQNHLGDSRHTYVFTHHILHSVIRELFDLLFNGVGLFELFACQVPTASVTIEGASALNRVRWSSGGKEVAVGDSEGRVWIYDIGEVLELTV